MSAPEERDDTCGDFQAGRLEEQFWGDVKTTAEAPDMILVKFALAAQDFGNDTRRAEDIREILLEKTVLLDKKLEHFERLGARELIVAGFEVLD